MTASLHIPEGARASGVTSSTLASGGNPYGQIQSQARDLTYGSTPGANVYTWAKVRLTLVGGAPQTVDFMAKPDFNGVNLAGLTGKLVYLEFVQVTGVSDVTAKNAVANSIDLLNATTDALKIYGRSIPIDLLPNSDLRTLTGPAFDATHKQLTFLSAAGAILDVLLAVV